MEAALRLSVEFNLRNQKQKWHCCALIKLGSWYSGVLFILFKYVKISQP